MLSRVFERQRKKFCVNALLASGYHDDETSLQKAIGRLAKNAQVNKRVNPHPLKHSFATHWLEIGYDIHTVQAQIGVLMCP